MVFFALSHNYAAPTFQLCLQSLRRDLFSKVCMKMSLHLPSRERERMKYFCIQVSNHYNIISEVIFPSEEYDNVIICENIVPI